MRAKNACFEHSNFFKVNVAAVDEHSTKSTRDQRSVRIARSKTAWANHVRFPEIQLRAF